MKKWIKSVENWFLIFIGCLLAGTIIFHQYQKIINEKNSIIHDQQQELQRCQTKVDLFKDDMAFLADENVVIVWNGCGYIRDMLITIKPDEEGSIQSTWVGGP